MTSASRETVGTWAADHEEDLFKTEACCGACGGRGAIEVGDGPVRWTGGPFDAPEPGEPMWARCEACDGSGWVAELLDDGSPDDEPWPPEDADAVVAWWASRDSARAR